MAQCSILINFTNKPSLDVGRIFFSGWICHENNKNHNIYKRYRAYCKRCIISIRDLKLSAISRVKHGKQNGGLWNAADELSQINFYKNILTNYILISTKHDINTTFIDFDKMVNDKAYLFNKLTNILREKNIDFETFSRVYDEISLTSKP